MTSRTSSRVTVAPVAAVRTRGHTLLVLQGTNSVAELGADGKVRWQVDGLQGPMDAEVLPGDRLLVAETRGRSFSMSPH